VLGHQRDRLGISEVGFAALARGEQPNPSRQVRWHIEDVFAGFQQPLRDAQAKAGGAFNGPPAIRPCPSKGQQASKSGGVDGQPTGAQHQPIWAQPDGGECGLVGVDTDSDHSRPFPIANMGNPRWAT
jgi:hypothetical protein